MVDSIYKRLRQYRGLRLGEVARICKVNKKTIERFEQQGSSNIKVKRWYDDLKREVFAELEEGNISYRGIRILSGHTQKDLERICGVDRRTIAHFEKGGTLVPNPKVLWWYEKTYDKLIENLESIWNEELKRRGDCDE